MAELSFFPNLDVDDPCAPEQRGSWGIGHYLKDCESDSIPTIVLIVLGFLIVVFALLAGLVIVRVQDARARRREEVDLLGDDEDERFPSYHDEETLVEEEKEVSDEKVGV